MESIIRNNSSEITPQLVAKYFLHKSPLSPKRIQKLVYYSYAWFIALNNQDPEHIETTLFSEKPEAWLHGPVFPTLYTEYKRFGWNDVPKEKGKVKLDKNVASFLDKIWDVFGKYDADELEYMTHQEDPWIKARNGISPASASNAKISDKDIFVYYNELAQK